MLKVFLVEDEVVVREGIQNNIQWEKEGFEFAGEASDGELALPLIQKTRPDIIITDIKMPFMDGLELSRLVKKDLPNVKIIILSGYNEFDYAKQAINIGITEYLLKPISSAKLLQAVKEVAEKITKENEQKELFELYRREMMENKNLDKQRFFVNLVSGKLSMSEILKMSQELDMNLVSTAYNIVLLNISRKNQDSTSYAEEIVGIVDTLKRIADESEELHMFDRAGGGWAFLILGDDAVDTEKIKATLMEVVVKQISKHENLEYFAGIGKAVQRLSELPESFEKADRAFSYRYLGKNNQLLQYEELKNINLMPEDEINLDSLDIRKIDRKLLENFLRSGTVEETVNFSADLFDGLGKENANSLLFRQYIAMDLYFGIVAFMEELGIKNDEIIRNIGDVKEVPGRLSTLENTRDYLSEILEKALTLRNSISMKKYSNLIDDAIRYMEENYAKEDIALNSVAASVNMSPSYFSSIFSQEVGRTFIEYLTGIRMEKAKELLRCTNMKTSEIGFEVGYNEPHYFSYIFKKTQNCSPKEFRSRGLKREEQN